MSGDGGVCMAMCCLIGVFFMIVFPIMRAIEKTHIKVPKTHMSPFPKLNTTFNKVYILDKLNETIFHNSAHKNTTSSEDSILLPSRKIIE